MNTVKLFASPLNILFIDQIKLCCLICQKKYVSIVVFVQINERLRAFALFRKIVPKAVRRRAAH